MSVSHDIEVIIMAQKSTKKQTKSTKTTKKTTKKAASQKAANMPASGEQVDAMLQKMDVPKDVQNQLKELKEKLEVFKNRLIERFEGYILGITVLPPQKSFKKKENDELDGDKKQQDKESSQENEQGINVLILVDDTDSKKMGKDELKKKLSGIIEQTAQEIDPNIKPMTIITSELWQNCYDSKYEYNEMIALGAPIYDAGMLAAIKIAEIHKSMILKKFEKYIVTYVLAGSLVQGKATPESDIDVFVVIDDTDVKKMSRTELRDKLRAIIIGMGSEAGEMTGIKNKLNIQVYILSDFWNSIKEANPVIFTFLRDGVPFYDRGIFMPWKQLLRMGKIKPSKESIEMYKGTGEQMLKRVHHKLNEIAMEDTFYSILTPSQAAIMLYGYPPPTPKEAASTMRDIFVKKEKLLEEEYVKMLEHNVQVRKDLEHGTIKEITGSDVEKLLSDAEKYLKRIEKLFEEIESQKTKETIVHIYENTVTLIRDALKAEGEAELKEKDVVKKFEDKLVSVGKIPDKFLRILKDIVEAKKDYDGGKLMDHELEKVRKESLEFTRYMIDFIQRKKVMTIERAKLRIKVGEQLHEVLLLENEAYVIEDATSQNKTVKKAKLDKSGALGELKESKPEAFEEAVAQLTPSVNSALTEKTFESLKKIFGSDMQILVNY
jgi:uncharacterized protein (UPF0332 family)/predicted nucleotidyltransferase